MTDKRLHVILPAEDHDRLKVIARQRGLSLSALVRRVLTGLETIPPRDEVK